MRDKDDIYEQDPGVLTIEDSDQVYCLRHLKITREMALMVHKREYVCVLRPSGNIPVSLRRFYIIPNNRTPLASSNMLKGYTYMFTVWAIFSRLLSPVPYIPPPEY